LYPLFVFYVDDDGWALVVVELVSSLVNPYFGNIEYSRGMPLLVREALL
jgi:hypothetical protein